MQMFMVLCLFAGSRSGQALGQWGSCHATKGEFAGLSPGRHMLKYCRLISNARAFPVKAYGRAGSSDHVLGASAGPP